MAGRVVYLVRHGHCEGAGTLLGHQDVPLTAEGRAQAEVLARELAGCGAERVVSSDLRRAAETAQVIAAAMALPVDLDPRLREISYGAWNGHPWQEGRAPAEPLADFQARVLAAWAAICAAPAAVTIVVAHRGVHAVILGDFGFEQPYGAAHRVEIP